MIFKCKVAHIVAVGRNGEIGKENKMLWHIPEDFIYFKNMTIGNSLVMGRNTFDGLPTKLKGRSVRVASRFLCDEGEEPLEYALKEASKMCGVLSTDVIWVAGGQQLYESTNNIVDEIFLTRVHATFADADTFYKIPEGFKFGGYTQKPIKTKEGWDVTFEKWVKA